VISLVILSLFCFTPLFNWYLTVVVSLPSDLIQYAKITLMLLIPVGLTFSLSNMFTGLIAFSGKTISLLTSTIVMLLVVFIGLMAAIILQPFEGIYAVAGVYLIASIVQLGWLYWTNKDSVANLEYDHA
jgi:O-antigen/teichoic acid export membrane protein